jgi:LEA14-like dessication related protein
MTKLVKIGLISAAVAVPILGYSYYRYALNAYTFKVKSGSVTKVDLQNGIIKLRLTIALTSKIGINFTLTSLNLQFFVNGILAATVAQQNNVIIPANGSSDLNVEVTIDANTVKSNIIKLITEIVQSKRLEIDVKGDTKLRMLGLPLDFNAPVQDKYLLSL